MLSDIAHWQKEQRRYFRRYLPFSAAFIELYEQVQTVNVNS